MASTLTSIIVKVQALLLDDGTAFSTATVTAAVRQALLAYNQRAPIFKTATITAVDGQYEYDLSGTSGIQRVSALFDSDNCYMPFEKYFKDGSKHYIRLVEPTGTDFTLVYATPHTIDGLDSESTTTLQANHENVLCDLAAGISTVIRANGKVETVNLNADVSEEHRNNWELWRQAFLLGIAAIQKDERMPVGKAVDGWSDSWSGWE